MEGKDPSRPYLTCFTCVYALAQKKGVFPGHRIGLSAGKRRTRHKEGCLPRRRWVRRRSRGGKSVGAVVGGATGTLTGTANMVTGQFAAAGLRPLVSSM